MATVDYKVQQNGLKTMLEIKMYGRVDYKVRQGLQSVAGITKRVSLNDSKSEIV